MRGLAVSVSAHAFTHTVKQARACHVYTRAHVYVGLVMGQTVEVGKKRKREKAWGIVRVFPHIQ